MTNLDYIHSQAPLNEWYIGYREAEETRLADTLSQVICGCYVPEEKLKELADSMRWIVKCREV